MFILGSKGPLAPFAEPFCRVLPSVVETAVSSPLVDKGEIVLPAVVKLEAENDVDESYRYPGRQVMMLYGFPGQMNHQRWPSLRR